MLLTQKLTILKNTIEIENMEFYSNHGCYREEKVVGNHFIVNLKMETSNSVAIKSDSIKDALNYQVAYEIVKDEMRQPSHLLEHVAGRILDKLFISLPLIESASVKVSKLNPPMGGKIEKVSVTINKNRN